MFLVRRDVVFFRFFFFERTRPAASMRPPCFIYLSTNNEARDRGHFLPEDKKPLHTGVHTGCHYSVCLSACLSAWVFVTFVVFTDCESCTGSIFTKPGSMEAGEYGLRRRTCFVARRVEVVAVAGMLWMSSCVLGAAAFCVFFPVCFCSNAHGLLQVQGRLASFISILVTEAVFSYREKEPLHAGVRTGFHCLISLSMCVLCMCDIRAFY